MIFSKLQIIQQQRLEEIGKYLNQTRLEERISLEAVEQQTRIQKSHLESIERGDLSRLPPGIYVQGFIKLYANFLGCDGMALATTFPIEEVTPQIRSLARSKANNETI